MTNYANIRYQPAAASTTTVADMAALIALTGMSNGDQALVQATNKLYIYSGTGWYIIATIQNDAPSAITGVSGTYELAIDGTATTITAASTDPEGFPLTWSYSTSGLGSIATISNTDNVFTITPSTTEADAGAFTLTINATDGINGAVSTTTNLTLEFIVIVTNSRYTTLLATATGTSDNNNITDASTNNHTITVNGDAYAGTFSPYRSGGYCTYFDGNDYLTTTQTNPLGTADFTIEGWINFDNVGGNRTIMTLDSTTQLYFRNNGSSIAIYKNSSAYNFSTGTPEVNTWYHFAFVRQSGSVTLYWNGQSKGSTSHAHDYTIGNLHIGCWSAISEFFQGHLMDIKISNTAVYTSNFSVPTERLSSDSSTQLITCHLPYIADGSNLAETIVVNGDPSTKPFSPYDRDEYSATDHGGSVHFAGTTDKFNAAGSSDYAPGTDEFTIKFWYYPKVQSSSVTYLVRQGTSTGNVGYWAIAHYSSGRIRRMQNVGGSFNSQYTANNVIKIGQWNYIEFYQNGASTGEIKVNGSSVITGANYVGNTDNLHFGNSVAADADLYISDIQIVKGSDARESSVPTAPMSSVSNTKLYIKGTDSSIIDKSQGANLKLVGTTTGSTTQVKFAGTKSIYSDGTAGNHIRIPADDSIFSKDYTIEFWMYPTQDTNLLMPFSKGYGLQFYHQSGNIAAAMSSSNNGTYFYNGNFGSITTNAWSHISLVRDLSASTYKFYINGILEDTLSSSTNINAGSSDWIIGAFLTSGNYTFEGYIQDVRVTEGLTRYTANFTPPTAPMKG